MMGLFKAIKEISLGRFRVVPKNWTYIYYRLFYEYKDSFRSPEAIMEAASIIESEPYYFDSRQFDPSNFSQIFRYAKEGSCGPISCMKDGFASWVIQHGEPAFFTETGEASYDLILNYCVQYTAVFLSIDTPDSNDRGVFEACVRAKSKIENSIRTVGRELGTGTANNPALDARISQALAEAKGLRPTTAKSIYLKCLLEDQKTKEKPQEKTRTEPHEISSATLDADRRAAEQGDVDAQFALGRAYDEGEGVSLDYKEAVKWYRRAAEQGHAWAQYYLGCAYSDGNGVSESPKEEAKWLRLAAEQGHVWAQFFLGKAYSNNRVYSNGEGVPQDSKEALKWYRRAAEQGYMDAQRYLGFYYRDGKGVPKDFVQAYAWFDVAAAHEDEEDEEAKECREETIKSMTPSQIEEGQRLSREYAAKFGAK